MRVRELLSVQSGEFGFLWKYPMLMGVLLVLAGLLIVIFPQILVLLVATAIIVAGMGLIGSAWRLRRLEQRTRHYSGGDVLEW